MSLEPSYEPRQSSIARRAGRDLILNWFLASKFINSAVRVRVLRRLGMVVGESVIIEPGCWFGGRDVSFGDRCFVNYHCFFDEYGPITIGADTEIGMDVTFATSTHKIGGPEHRCGEAFVKPIEVGPGCWLAARVTVLPGVRIGAGCVVAAGAVVASDCEPNGFYAGVPARRIRDL